MKNLEFPILLGLTFVFNCRYACNVESKQPANIMLNATLNTNPQIIRNYFITAATVMLMSVGVADLFNNYSRVGKQERLDSYGPYMSAVLVNYGKRQNLAPSP